MNDQDAKAVESLCALIHRNIGGVILALSMEVFSLRCRERYSPSSDPLYAATTPGPL